MPCLLLAAIPVVDVLFPTLGPDVPMVVAIPVYLATLAVMALLWPFAVQVLLRRYCQIGSARLGLLSAGINIAIVVAALIAWIELAKHHADV